MYSLKKIIQTIASEKIFAYTVTGFYLFVLYGLSGNFFFYATISSEDSAVFKVILMFYLNYGFTYLSRGFVSLILVILLANISKILFLKEKPSYLLSFRLSLLFLSIAVMLFFDLTVNYFSFLLLALKFIQSNLNDLKIRAFSEDPDKNPIIDISVAGFVTNGSALQKLKELEVPQDLVEFLSEYTSELFKVPILCFEGTLKNKVGEVICHYGLIGLPTACVISGLDTLIVSKPTPHMETTSWYFQWLYSWWYGKEKAVVRKALEATDILALDDFSFAVASYGHNNQISFGYIGAKTAKTMIGSGSVSDGIDESFEEFKPTVGLKFVKFEDIHVCTRDKKMIPLGALLQQHIPELEQGISTITLGEIEYFNQKSLKDRQLLLSNRAKGFFEGEIFNQINVTNWSLIGPQPKAQPEINFFDSVRKALGFSTEEEVQKKAVQDLLLSPLNYKRTLRLSPFLRTSASIEDTAQILKYAGLSDLIEDYKKSRSHSSLLNLPPVVRNALGANVPAPPNVPELPEKGIAPLTLLLILNA